MILKCLYVIVFGIFSKMLMIVINISLAYIHKNCKWNFIFDFFFFTVRENVIWIDMLFIP